MHQPSKVEEAPPSAEEIARMERRVEVLRQIQADKVKKRKSTVKPKGRSWWPWGLGVLVVGLAFGLAFGGLDVLRQIIRH